MPTALPGLAGMTLWSKGLRFIPAALAVAVVALGAAADLTAPRSYAQSTGVELSEETRDKLYETLRRAEPEIERFAGVLKTVVRLVGPTVVHIETEKDERGTTRFSGRRVIEEAGSGVVIRLKDRCYVLTNWHVIKNAPATSIKIKLSDGRELAPSSESEIWHDAATDVAVIGLRPTDLLAARLGDSNKVEIGDFVLAVGSPFGLSHSVTYGIVSAKGRRDLELGDEGVRYQDFLQTDAAINPGNSGGPLINLRGEVVGINTAIASNSGGNEGIGFSIPINMVMTIARQLVERGEVTRAYLGVKLSQTFDAAEAARLGMNRRRGALINGITANSPAEAAKLRPGDVVLRFDGIAVENDAHLINLVSLMEVDREVPVVIFRDRQEMTINVRVGNRSQYEPRTDARPPANSPIPDIGSNDVESRSIEALGLRVAPLDPHTVARLRNQRLPGGLLVVDVDSQGPCAGRVRAGDIIDQVEQRTISAPGDLEKLLASVDPARGLRMRVRSSSGQQQANPRLLVIKPAPSKGVSPQPARTRQTAER